MVKRMEGYDIFAVIIVVDCPNCKLAVSVQNMDEKKICPHCMKTFDCDWKKRGRFETALVDQLERAIETRSATSSDTILSVSVEVKNEIPCETCMTPLQFTDGSDGIISCKACNGPNYIKKVDQPSGIDFLANGYFADEMAAMQNDFSVSCISCGASVPIKGNNRTVTCNFCSRDTLISDAVWQKIHPELYVKPFYMVTKNLLMAAKSAESISDEQVMMIFAEHFYYKVRAGLAKNPSLSEGVARILLKDRNGEVVNKLRKNPLFNKWFTPVNVFSDPQQAKLFAQEFPEETNPDLGELEMLELAKQRMPKRLEALVYNPSITNEVMKQIIRQKLNVALVAMAKRTDLDAEILKLLVNCNDLEVNKIVSANNGLPLQCIQRLSVSNDKEVLNGLLLNPNLPADIKIQVLDRLKKF